MDAVKLLAVDQGAIERYGNDARIVCLPSGHHVLYHTAEFWMTDTRGNVQEMAELAARSWGDVLIGGYGLGVLHRFLLENPAVDSITTVEYEQGVISECLRVFGWVHGQVLLGDFLDIELYRGRQWDTVIGDLWADATEEWNWLFDAFCDIAPDLVRPGGTILAWKEQAFRGRGIGW